MSRANTKETSGELVMRRSTPEPNTGCWLWEGNASNGYGKIKIGGKSIPAHKVSFEAFVGEVPVGLLVCHRCDNPPCVNTDHLFLGTQGDNSTDKARKCRGVTSRKGLPFGVKTCVNGARFGSQVRYRGVKYHLGSYPTAAEASAAAVAFKEQLLSTTEIK